MGRHRDRDLRPGQRLLERQRDRGLEVAPALGGRLGPRAAVGRRAEEVGEDVAPAAAGRAARSTAAERRAAREHRAAAVVALALLRIAQGVVGLGDRLEALLGPGLLVRVRVVLARELAVGLLDVLLGGLLVDPQGLVMVWGPGHGYSAPQVVVATRARAVRRGPAGACERAARVMRPPRRGP